MFRRRIYQRSAPPKVAREQRFLLYRDAVDVRGVGGEGQAHALLVGVVLHGAQQPGRPLGASLLQHVVQRLQPLLQFDLFDVLCLMLTHDIPVVLSRRMMYGPVLPNTVPGTSVHRRRSRGRGPLLRHVSQNLLI